MLKFLNTSIIDETISLLYFPYTVTHILMIQMWGFSNHVKYSRRFKIKFEVNKEFYYCTAWKVKVTGHLSTLVWVSCEGFVCKVVDIFSTRNKHEAAQQHQRPEPARCPPATAPRCRWWRATESWQPGAGDLGSNGGPYYWETLTFIHIFLVFLLYQRRFS